MSWATVKEACRTAISVCLGLEDYPGGDGSMVHQVEWKNKQMAMRWTTEKWVDLQLTAGNSGTGTDEVRWCEVQVGARTILQPTYGGYRQFSVQVTICSESQEDADEAVGELADRLRTRIRRPDVQAPMQDAGVALVRVGSTFETDYQDQDGRMVSCSVTELRMGCVTSETDTTDPGYYIAEVQIEFEDDCRTFDIST